MTTTATCHPAGCLEGDCVPCLDCGTTVHAKDDCYAVDCGGVCIPCGQTRYSDNTEYLLGPMRGYETRRGLSGLAAADVPD